MNYNDNYNYNSLFSFHTPSNSNSSCDINNIVSSTNQPSVSSSSSHFRNHPVEDGEICMICGDLATGRHYGVISCEGCKGFFRRTAIFKKEFPNLTEPWANRNGVPCTNDCQITKEDRRTGCKSCRYRKCLEAGMRYVVERRNDTKYDYIFRDEKIKESLDFQLETLQIYHFSFADYVFGIHQYLLSTRNLTNIHSLNDVKMFLESLIDLREISMEMVLKIKTTIAACRAAEFHLDIQNASNFLLVFAFVLNNIRTGQKLPFADSSIPNYKEIHSDLQQLRELLLDFLPLDMVGSLLDKFIPGSASRSSIFNNDLSEFLKGKLRENSNDSLSNGGPAKDKSSTNNKLFLNNCKMEYFLYYRERYSFMPLFMVASLIYTMMNTATPPPESVCKLAEQFQKMFIFEYNHRKQNEDFYIMRWMEQTSREALASIEFTKLQKIITKIVSIISKLQQILPF